jgi:hypothetical protein
MAIDETTASKRPSSGSGAVRSCSTSSMRSSSAKRSRAASSMSSEKSRPTPSISRRPVRRRASRRPSPVPGSRTRRASRGTCSSRTLSPSARRGYSSARPRHRPSATLSPAHQPARSGATSSRRSGANRSRRPQATDMLGGGPFLCGHGVIIRLVPRRRSFGAVPVVEPPPGDPRPREPPVIGRRVELQAAWPREEILR